MRSGGSGGAGGGSGAGRGGRALFALGCEPLRDFCCARGGSVFTAGEMAGSGIRAIPGGGPDGVVSSTPSSRVIGSGGGALRPGLGCEGRSTGVRVGSSRAPKASALGEPLGV